MTLQAESLRDIGEELRNLRRAISEDLLRGMAEISQKSESHRLLYSTVKDSLLLAPVGEYSTTSPGPDKRGSAHDRSAHRPPDHAVQLRPSPHLDQQQLPPPQQQQQRRRQQPNSAWSQRCCTAQVAEPESVRVDSYRGYP